MSMGTTYASEDMDSISEAYYVLENGDEIDLVSVEGGEAEISVAEKILPSLIDPQVAEKLSVISKSLGVLGSNQTEFSNPDTGLTSDKLVQPPYDPNVMTALSQMDEVAYSCSRAKAFDATKRHFTLDKEWDPLIPEDESSITDEEFIADAKVVKKFLRRCAGPYPDFQEILYKAQMDVETIGWGCIEVIRSADGVVRTLTHVPASRVKVYKGWKGFEEQGSNGKKVYYQPFGTKVVSTTRINAMDGSPEPYDPEEDGVLNIQENGDIEFNLLDKRNGKPTNDFLNSANELIWMVKTHPSTIYYGVSDNIPAMPHILANHHISNYLLQYFEHNTVPRYVVVIKGTRMDKEVKQAIVNFFRTSVKGRAHSTLVIPLPAGQVNAEIEFKPLDSISDDKVFRETQKDKQHSIRLAHNVPAAVACFSDNASLGSGKGNAQLEMYRDRYVSPAQRSQSDVITKVFRLGLGITTVRGRFEELDVRNQEALMRLLTQYFDRGIIDGEDVKRIAKLGPPSSGGSRSYRVAGGKLIFTDELDKLTSSYILDPSGEDDAEHGGERRLNIDVKKEPENNFETAADSAMEVDT